MSPSPEVSFITSLYRCDNHFPHYAEHAVAVSDTLREKEIAIEFIFIANDASEQERSMIDRLCERLPHTHVEYVARENLYASWNRGLKVASAPYIGMWNVDDVRHPVGVLEAVQALRQGVMLVDSQMEVIKDGVPYEILPAMYLPKVVDPKRLASPFAIFNRDIYTRAGDYNPNFRIVGDFEWASRPEILNASHTILNSIGGDFHIHGGNLSNGNRPLEWVEINIVLIWRNTLNQLRPVDPKLMHDVWNDWGHTGGEVSDEVAEWLWGDGSQTRYEAYTREHNAPTWQRRIRLALARRNLFPSIEWNVTQKPRWVGDNRDA